MKTEYDAYAAFLYPNTGEQERRFFYALMLRSRGEKSLAICGFAGALLPRTGIYISALKNGALLRNRKAENRPLMKVICSLLMFALCLSALMISYCEYFLINVKLSCFWLFSYNFKKIERKMNFR